MEDDYTLMSSKDVAELKQDVDYLKKNPLGGTKSGKSLLEGIEKLNENISQLIEIFKEAGEQVKAEERESDVIVQKIEPMERKLEELSDQNQKIAKGILAVADMVSAKEQRPQKLAPINIPRPPMPRPMMPSRPMMPPPPAQKAPGLPPLPPPKKEEKKGFLGFLKKK